MTKWEEFATKLGYLTEKAMWQDLYLAEGLSIKELSVRLKISTCTINRRLEQHSIDRRSRGGNNSVANQSHLLFHLDQRIVMQLPLEELSTLVRVSKSLCYKYRRRRYGILRDNTDRWAGKVRFINSPTFVTSTSPGSEVR